MHVNLRAPRLGNAGDNNEWSWIKILKEEEHIPHQALLLPSGSLAAPAATTDGNTGS